MSDLEFKRELSPDQLRDALSLLDRAAGAKPENLQVGDLSSAEGGDPGADQASTTMAAQASCDRRPPAACEASKPCRRRLFRPCHRGHGDAGAVVVERARADTSVSIRDRSRAAFEPAVRAECFFGAPSCHSSTEPESRWIRATALDAGGHRFCWLPQPR